MKRCLLVLVFAICINGLSAQYSAYSGYPPGYPAIPRGTWLSNFIERMRNSALGAFVRNFFSQVFTPPDYDELESRPVQRSDSTSYDNEITFQANTVSVSDEIDEVDYPDDVISTRNNEKDHFESKSDIKGVNATTSHKSSFGDKEAPATRMFGDPEPRRPIRFYPRRARKPLPIIQDDLVPFAPKHALLDGSDLETDFLGDGAAPKLFAASHGRKPHPSLMIAQQGQKNRDIPSEMFRPQYKSARIPQSKRGRAPMKRPRRPVYARPGGQMGGGGGGGGGKAYVVEPVKAAVQYSVVDDADYSSGYLKKSAEFTMRKREESLERQPLKPALLLKKSQEDKLSPKKLEAAFSENRDQILKVRGFDSSQLTGSMEVAIEHEDISVSGIEDITVDHLTATLNIMTNLAKNKTIIKNVDDFKVIVNPVRKTIRLIGCGKVEPTKYPGWQILRIDHCNDSEIQHDDTSYESIKIKAIDYYESDKDEELSKNDGEEFDYNSEGIHRRLKRKKVKLIRRRGNSEDYSEEGVSMVVAKKCKLAAGKYRRPSKTVEATTKNNSKVILPAQNSTSNYQKKYRDQIIPEETMDNEEEGMVKHSLISPEETSNVAEIIISHNPDQNTSKLPMDNEEHLIVKHSLISPEETSNVAEIIISHNPDQNTSKLPMDNEEDGMVKHSLISPEETSNVAEIIISHNPDQNTSKLPMDNEEDLIVKHSLISPEDTSNVSERSTKPNDNQNTNIFSNETDQSKIIVENVKKYIETSTSSMLEVNISSGFEIHEDVSVEDSERISNTENDLKNALILETENNDKKSTEDAIPKSKVDSNNQIGSVSKKYELDSVFVGQNFHDMVVLEKNNNLLEGTEIRKTVAEESLHKLTRTSNEEPSRKIDSLENENNLLTITKVIILDGIAETTEVPMVYKERNTKLIKDSLKNILMVGNPEIQTNSIRKSGHKSEEAAAESRNPKSYLDIDGEEVTLENYEGVTGNIKEFELEGDFIDIEKVTEVSLNDLQKIVEQIIEEATQGIDGTATGGYIDNFESAKISTEGMGTKAMSEFEIAGQEDGDANSNKQTSAESNNEPPKVSSPMVVPATIILPNIIANPLRFIENEDVSDKSEKNKNEEMARDKDDANVTRKNVSINGKKMKWKNDDLVIRKFKKSASLRK